MLWFTVIRSIFLKTGVLLASRVSVSNVQIPRLYISPICDCLYDEVFAINRIDFYCIDIACKRNREFYFIVRISRIDDHNFSQCLVSVSVDFVLSKS